MTDTRTSARALIFVLVTLCGPSVAGGQERPALPADFDATVARLMQDWSIPGAAIAVVRADRAPAIRTYGLRQWNRPERVDEGTMFGVASITKTFVAAGIGLLAQQGKLSWDDPVVKHLPEFRVRDAWISRHVTIRDLLAHRSGVASHGDFLEEVPGLSEAALRRKLAHYDQSMPFRAGAEYNNYAYVVLAGVIEQVSGQPWGSFLRQRLWQPLRMDGTYAHADDFAPPQHVLPTGDGWSDFVPTGLDAVAAGVNVAAPHVRPEAYYAGEFVYDPRELDNELAHFHRTAIDPSQSVFSSVRDMARWAQLLLAPGEGSNDEAAGEANESAGEASEAVRETRGSVAAGSSAGERGAVLSRETILAMRRLTSVSKGDWPLNLPDAAGDPQSRWRQVGFGLGLEIYAYRGRTLFGHSGGELGYNALLAIDPQAGLAVVALVNNAWRTWGAEQALVQTVFDWHYGAARVDWSRRYLQDGAREHAQNLAFIAQLAAAKPLQAPSLALRGYAGTYCSPLFGPLRVEERQGRLYATTGPTWEIELDHWGEDVFRGAVVSPLRLGAYARFTVDEAGKARALELEFVELWGTKFRFERR